MNVLETSSFREFYKKNKSSNANEQSGGRFYFYNSSTVAYGKQEFRRIWGDRTREDNWRRSDRQRAGITEEIVVEEDTPISENERFKPETYIALVPTDQKVFDSLTKERDFAYYQLGLIYKEKFKEYGLAANRLEKLLTYNPEERLVLPSKYNLYLQYP